MSKNGSLFIKHLQNESKIIIDKKDELSKILDEFTPKNNYKKDIQDCKKYFDIVKVIPKTDLGLAWFCDNLYVGIRNYLVFQNAQNGIFEFSFIKLLNGLKKQRKIDQSDIEILKELRVIKRNYREEIKDELPCLSFIQKVIPIVKRIGILDDVKIVESLTFQNLVEKSIIRKRFNPYQRLRLVEGFYCSQDLSIPELKRIISNPQFYSSKMKNADFTMSLISKIKNATQQCISVIADECLIQK